MALVLGSFSLSRPELTGLTGAAVAFVIGWLVLKQQFFRVPFRDWRALGLWLLVIALDVGAYALAAGGYVWGHGVPHARASTFIGAIFLGAAVPLALRSPVRESAVRGRNRQVGVTWIYDWLKALFEDPLDGRIAVLRRSEERDWEKKLNDAGWTSEGLIGELKQHLDHLQRRSEADRKTILSKANQAKKTLGLLGVVVVITEARCTALFSGLKDENAK